MSESINIVRMNFNGKEISSIKDFYNPNSKKSSETLLTQKAVVEAINATSPKQDFLNAHRQNMLFDTLTVKDGVDTTYGIAIEFKENSFVYNLNCLSNATEIVYLASKVHKEGESKEYVYEQNETNVLNIPATVSEVFISRKIQTKPSINFLERTSDVKIHYPQPDTESNPMTLEDEYNISRLILYINDSHNDCHIASGFKCYVLYLTDNFFDDVDIDNATTAIVNITYSNADKVHIENKYLNTTLTGDDLREKIRILLGLTTINAIVLDN